MRKGECTQGLRREALLPSGPAAFPFVFFQHKGWKSRNAGKRALRYSSS